jgi:phosphonoacetaldehyde hydrolase
LAIKAGAAIGYDQAARNAGMWVVGVTMTGNGLGLSQVEAESLSEADLNLRLSTLEEEYLAADAHFVVRSATDLVPVLDEINARLSNE